MKFCTQCGEQLADDANFCIKCGAKANPPSQTERPQQSPYFAEQSSYNNFDNSQPPYPQSSGNSINAVIDAIGESFNTPVFIFTIIAYTLFAAMSLIGIFTGASALGSIQDTLNQFSTDISVSFASGSVSIILGLISFIPTLLCVLGIWKIYSARFDRPLAAGGFKLVRICVVIRLVLMCIAMALVLIAFILILGASGDITNHYSFYPDYYGYARPVLIAAAVIVVACLAVCILFYAKELKTLRTIEAGATQGLLVNNISTFVAVFCIIIAVFTLISLPSSPTVSALLRDLCSSAMYAGTGIYLFQLKNRLLQFYPPRQF